MRSQGPLMFHAAETAEVVEATDEQAVTRGRSVSGPFTLETEVQTQFDGLMRVRTTLSAKRPAKLQRFRVVIPLKPEHASYLGYWSGSQNFRRGHWYGAMPRGSGPLLLSHDLSRPRHRAMRGSFIPFLMVADAQRGLHWFAENDRNWTKTNESPAVALVRRGDQIELRLNLIQTTTEIDQPLAFEFGLQLTPVRELSGHRELTRSIGFAHVDGFSKQSLKSDRGAATSMTIAPEHMDWRAAAKRARIHRFHYDADPGYDGPILYTDRPWGQVPPNASEYRPLIYSGGFCRYLRPTRDIFAYYLNEWLERDLIRGIYIDDVWIRPTTSLLTGPAYELPDGHVQPGYEFFDYHAYLKRVRWLFHDHGKQPLIWIHATNTLFIPCLSFADVILDGEWRFPRWGQERDFVGIWGLNRLRLLSPQKWGIATNWMIKIGNDERRPTGMAIFEDRQQRAYVAGTAMHDLGRLTFWSNRYLNPDGRNSGLLIYDDAAKFAGYWAEPTVIRSPDAGVYASVWYTDRKAHALVWNHAKQARVVTLHVTPQNMGWTGSVDRLQISSLATQPPPDTVDYTRLKTPDNPAAELGEGPDDGTEAMLDMFETELARDEKPKPDFDFTDQNLQRIDGGLRVKLRPRDFRLIELRR